MPFVKGNDPNRNLSGNGGKALKEQRAKEAANPRSRLRKTRNSLEKHITEAIAKAADVMNSAVKEETALRAAMFIVQEYVNVNNKIIEEERKAREEILLRDPNAPELTDDDEDDNSAAVFSLNLVKD